MSQNLPAALVVRRLKRKKLTVATAESITGGGVAEEITSVAGSSAVFLGGYVSYSDESKVKLLGISRRTLSMKTAVSEEVAREMAQATLRNFGSDYAIATTGVAGPGKAYGQRAGTVWIAIASNKETLVVELHLAGDRQSIRHATIASALATFERILG